MLAGNSSKKTCPCYRSQQKWKENQVPHHLELPSNLKIYSANQI